MEGPKAQSEEHNPHPKPQTPNPKPGTQRSQVSDACLGLGPDVGTGIGAAEALIVGSGRFRGSSGFQWLPVASSGFQWLPVASRV